MWREILDYFKSATHIGLTATPKETKYVSNVHYFGEPVYVYSLKQGIEDGSLPRTGCTGSIWTRTCRAGGRPGDRRTNTGTRSRTGSITRRTSTGALSWSTGRNWLPGKFRIS